MDISTLVPLPVHISPKLYQPYTDGGRNGAGVAVCRDLNLLVISRLRELQVFALPEDIARGGVRGDLGAPRVLVPVYSIFSVWGFPMEFQFWHGSGNMAFMVGCGDAISSRLLLVTDSCETFDRDAVHVIDVVSGTHMGYVAAPGTITLPRGVATQKSLAAVSMELSARV